MAEACPPELRKIYEVIWPGKPAGKWNEWFETCYRAPEDDVSPFAPPLFESFEEPNSRIFEKKVALAFRKPPFCIEDMQVNLGHKDGGVDCA